MKRQMMRIFILATLLLGVAGLASGEDHACSTARMAGDWAYTFTGTVILPTGAAVPMAVVGKGTSDHAGNTVGKQTSSTGGSVSQNETVKGIFAVNSDCTGTLTVSIYDASGNVLRTATWAAVIENNETEIRAIATSLVLANGTRLLPIVTMNMRMMSPW